MLTVFLLEMSSSIVSSQQAILYRVLFAGIVGLAKLRNIVADTLFPVMFHGWLNWCEA